MSPYGSYHGCGNLDQEFNGESVIYKQVKPKYKTNLESTARTIFAMGKRSGDHSPLSTHNTPHLDINKTFLVYSYTVVRKENSGKLLCFLQVKSCRCFLKNPESRGEN